MTFQDPRLRINAPLWARILAIVVGALAAAQLVTLALTVFFPPAPPQQYSLSDIGSALRGAVDADSDRPLVRTFETAPPSLQSPGWVVSPAATGDLAKLLNADQDDVRLLFYAPPPLAGIAPPPPPPGPPRSARHEASRGYVLAGMVMMGQGMPGPQGGRPPGPGPGMGPQQGMAQNGGFRPGMGGPQGGGDNRFQGQFGRRPDQAQGTGGPQGNPTGNPGFGRSPSGAAGISAPGGAGGGGRPAGISQTFGGGVPNGVRTGGGALVTRGPTIRSPLDAAVFGAHFSWPILLASQPKPAAAPAPPAQAPAQAVVRTEPPLTTPAPIERATRPVSEPLVASAAVPAKPVDATASTAPAVAAAQTLPPPETRAGFGFRRPSYIEGEFVAAWRQGDGRWAMVRPRSEGFPNAWQRRVMLWFGLSVALIAPIVMLVAWRMAAPLKAFAETADRLGREPSADLPPLTGPAEIGKAAEAFNLMHRRVKRYVDDRTGMVRAISHDLRTPLARMRFKLERAPPGLRQAIGRDMDQMEAMIASVLSFMRDEMQVAPRQVVDLRSLLEVVVDDAAGPVRLEPGPAVLVEVDVVAVQRVMENLIDNAVKYGDRAVLGLEMADGEARVTVRDEGPGLSPDELAQVFEPFYRSAEARASGKSGVGLGLSVSRSTIRAHGGELTLRSADDGLVAEIRLPAIRPVLRPVEVAAA